MTRNRNETGGSAWELPRRARLLPWLLLAPLSAPWVYFLFRGGRLIAAMLAGGGDPARLRSDYLVFWPAGHLVLAHHAARIIYDPGLFTRWMGGHFGAGLPAYLTYFYPPPSLLTTLILAPFSLRSGLAVWTLAIALPCIPLLRRGGAPWPVIAAGLLSGASLSGLTLGQFGPLGGSLLITALVSLAGRPVAAGGLIGLISLKPQAGLLAPVVLLARGEIKALTAAAVVVVALAGAVTVIAGPAIWPAFIHYGMAAEHAHLVAPFPSEYEASGVTVFWMARSLGGSVAVAAMAQMLAAGLAIAWCWRAWRRYRAAADRIALVALTVCLTLLVTPYGYVNDMTGFSIMVAWLAWQRGRVEPTDILLWLWPVLSPVVVALLHVELAPVAILLGAQRAQAALDGIGRPVAACYAAPT